MKSADKIFWRIAEVLASGKPIDNTTVEIWKTAVRGQLERADGQSQRDPQLVEFVRSNSLEISVTSN